VSPGRGTSGSQPLANSRRGRAALARLASARAPLLFIDLDGTLAPFTERPMDARVPGPTRRTLKRLRATGATVVLVSGRSVPQVRKVAQVAVDAIIGDHGARYAVGGATGDLHGAVRPLLHADVPAFQRAVARVRERLHGHPGLRLEVKDRSIAVHFRHMGHEHEIHEEHAVARLLREEGLRALLGHHVVDGQLPGIDKGRGVLAWLARERHKHHDAVMYAGDDTTDQDALRALHDRGITIAVGPRAHPAQLRTRDPYTFATWLDRLATARAKRGMARLPAVTRAGRGARDRLAIAS